MNNLSQLTEKSSSKKAYLYIGVVVVVMAVLFAVKIYKSQKTPSSQPAPTQQSQPSAANDEDLLKQAFAEKYSIPTAQISVTITKQIGQYASGQVQVGSEPGSGGVWFAVKQAGAWKIAADGNGIPSCSDLDQYSIPTELISSCVGANGQIQQR